MSVTIRDAAAMNASAYLPSLEQMPALPGWTCTERFEHADSGVVIARWEAQTGHTYLAVRGSATPKDVAQNLLIFLGQEPTARMDVLRGYVENRCADALARGLLAVGGHSLGGLVAESAAARWNLPGLAQNAPGWMANPPAPEQLDRFLEIRTSRDVVGDWGHPTPRSLVIQAPHVPLWKLGSIHSVLKQNQAIEEHGLADLRVDDPRLGRAVDADPVVPGVAQPDGAGVAIAARAPGVVGGAQGPDAAGRTRSPTHQAKRPIAANFFAELLTGKRNFPPKQPWVSDRLFPACAGKTHRLPPTARSDPRPDPGARRNRGHTRT